MRHMEATAVPGSTGTLRGGGNAGKLAVQPKVRHTGNAA